MRNQLSLVILAAILCACNMTPPETKSETYEISTDSLYTICSDLKGIGMFEIGKTTWKDVMYAKVLHLDSWDRHPNWYNGDKWCVKDHEDNMWIAKNAKRVKRYPVSCIGLHPYAIGDITFRAMDLAFLDGILVGAYFIVDEKKADVLNHYKEKYGNGNGKYYYYYATNGNTKDMEHWTYTKNEDEEHKWENEKIAMEYHHHLHASRTPTNSTYHEDRFYIVYDKEKLPIFEAEFEALKTQLQDVKEKASSDALNSL